MDLIQEVKNFVESESLKADSKYGAEPFYYHFTSVVEYAKRLAVELGGDEEVVTIAGWLHDIGSIMHGRADHHLTGAKIAEEKLKAWGYPAEKIALVKKCILNHRGSQQNDRHSLEEQIVAEADTMSNFDNLAGLFKAALVYENLNQGEAKDSVRQKLERKYKKLHFAKSQELIKPKFEAAMLLLK
ncbi:MAG: HD domain-containing protein [Candidatus Buchananbacteria bacterium]